MSEATPVENGSSKPNKPPVNLALIVAVVALGLTGWQYLDTRQQLNKAQQALAVQLFSHLAVSRCRLAFRSDWLQVAWSIAVASV